MRVQRRRGRLGQFDVVVDGEIIAARGRAPFRSCGGGWPEPEQVIACIAALLRAKARA